MCTSSDEATWSILPPELIEKIFHHLEIEDLLMCSQTCRHWRSLCSVVTLNPLLQPKVIRIVFQHLNYQSILQARLVCKLWKTGLDVLTAGDAVVIKGQTTITSRRTTHRILKEMSSVVNPFPSRTVRLSFIVNKKKSIDCREVIPEIEIVRLHGTEIKYLNLKIMTCSMQKSGLLCLVKLVCEMLAYLTNLVGLSLDLSLASARATGTDIQCGTLKDETSSAPKRLGEDVTIPKLDKLRALRLGAWNFPSEETEWLYYTILKKSPNLRYFDPDYFFGYKIFHEIYSQPKLWPFTLTGLKIAVPGSKYLDALKVLNEAKLPLTDLMLDIFNINWRKHPKLCLRILTAIIRNCRSTIRTLAVCFYTAPQDDRFMPLQIMSSRDGHHELDLDMNYRSIAATYAIKLHNFLHVEQPCKLENLKLRGYRGPLDFLKEFQHLKRLLLFHYENPDQQRWFNCEEAFYRHLPSLKDLYTPLFGSFDAKSMEATLIAESYLPLYIDVYTTITVSGLASAT